MEIRQTRGVVLRSTGSWYEVCDADSGNVYSCRAGGRLRLQGDRSTNPFAVGDDVVIEFHGEDEPPLIVERKQRRNAISLFFPDRKEYLEYRLEHDSSWEGRMGLAVFGYI